MTVIETLLQEPVAQAIGWALLHFVWQGALVAALTAVSLALLRQSNADVRYTIAAIALAVMGTLPVVTAVQTYNAAIVQPVWKGTDHIEAPPAVQPLAGETQVVMPADVTAGPLNVGQAKSWSSALTSLRTVEPWIPMLVVSWVVGVAVLTLRLFSGWIRVQRMKTHGATVVVREWQASVARLSKRLHIYRPVRLIESAHVDVPTVIGWLKPVILLPVSGLAGLTPTQVEAILAHELAHIRRHDYLVNLLQALLETLLFYHPAVWWLSRRIRAERENCCDDLAVSLCGDPIAYARALADLEELRGACGHLAMAANGGHLLTRVRRLLLAAPAAHDGRGPVWVAGATALAFVFSTGVAVVKNAPSQEPLELSITASDAPQSQPSQPSEPSRPSESSRPSQPSRQQGPRPTATSPMQSVPSVPSAPSAPLAPSPSEPSAPSAVSVSQSISSHNNHIVWSHNGEKVEVRWNGEFVLADDDMDVKSMTPGSQLRISDGAWLRGRSVEFATDASGRMTRRYWVGSDERPFEPEGRDWLSKVLPRFVRESGLGAKGRVARIYKAKGADGVLAEISAIQGSWVKKVYYTELLNLDINADTRRRVIEMAGRDLTSDYELASLLISQTAKLPADAGVRKAYFEAARSIQSDYEMRRVFSEGLKGGALDATLLATMLEASQNINSDYEQASLLVQVVKQQSIETVRGPYFAALGTIAGGYERGRVLQAVAERPDLSNETLAAMLTAAGEMRSDYESAQFLLKVVNRPIEGALHNPFFHAVEGLGSGYERGRVLKAVASQPQMSNETMLALLQSVKAMHGDYEASQVLQTLAAKHTITGAARDAYIDATERLGEYEQGRALSALVKNDRTRK